MSAKGDDGRLQKYPVERKRADEKEFSVDVGTETPKKTFHDVVNPIYLFLAAAETVYWYWLAPGIDPASRWFSPSDASLITDQLLNPSVVLSPPPGSGLGLSSLLLNSFLILPSVYSLLLLQEAGWSAPPDRRQPLPPLPFCAAGHVVGGGALVPYMILRRSRGRPGDVDPRRLPGLLRAFEGRGRGDVVLVLLLAVVFAAFVWPFCSGASVSWEAEWTAFAHRARTSQFTSLAVFDLVMLSFVVLDPMADDARRRGLLSENASLREATTVLAPYVLIPLVGPVAWICRRPRYDVRD